MSTDRTTAPAGKSDTRPDGLTGGRAEGAAVHPRFLRLGPWALSVVVATLFALSFATSYAALYDYAQQLEFSREFAIAFPLVLDAVIVVLAVTLLLERALGRRTVTIKGWRFTVRLPTWPLLALWTFFVGSVAGNVGHAPAIVAAQLVAAVPPVSAALTFHLLLRLLDRAPALRAIAEEHEERQVEEQERAARRKARRAAIKADSRPQPRPVPARGQPGHRTLRGQLAGSPTNGGAAPASGNGTPRIEAPRDEQLDELRERVHTALASGERITGEMVGNWLGASARTGRRKLAALLTDSPSGGHG